MAGGRGNGDDEAVLAATVRLRELALEAGQCCFQCSGVSSEVNAVLLLLVLAEVLALLVMMHLLVMTLPSWCRWCSSWPWMPTLLLMTSVAFTCDTCCCLESIVEGETG